MEVLCADCEIFVMTFEEAELCKLYHNGFNAAKISYFNQAARMSSAVAEISGRPVSMSAIQQALPVSCEGLWNLRYGIRSGMPFSGHCLPKDSQALAFLEDALLGNDPRPAQSPAMFADIVAVNRCMPMVGIKPQAVHAPTSGFLSSDVTGAKALASEASNSLSSLAGVNLLKVHSD